MHEDFAQNHRRMNSPIINQASPRAAASASAANMAARLPNFCNLGIMLRLVLLVNALMIGAAVVKSEPSRELWGQFLLMSTVVQPAIIASLLLSCALQPLFLKLAYWQGVSLILALETLLGAGLWWLLPQLMPFIAPMALWQFAFFLLFITAAVLLYFTFRLRALFPAPTPARPHAHQARN